MVEGNTKTCIFILLLQSLLSAHSGSPHLRNSFYVTSQKRKAALAGVLSGNMLAIKKGLGRRPTRGCKYGDRAANSTKQDCPFDIQGHKMLGKIATKHFLTFRDAQSPSGHTAPTLPDHFRGTVLFVSCGQRRAWNANLPSALTVPFIQLLPHHQFTTRDLQAESKPNGWTSSFHSEITWQTSPSTIINEKKR